jgi:hypothetical protein
VIELKVRFCIGLSSDVSPGRQSKHISREVDTLMEKRSCPILILEHFDKFLSVEMLEVDSILN